MSSYLFKGQDRRDLSKTILGLTRILSRDVLAQSPKKTTAISTRQTMLDSLATFPGQQRQTVQYVLAVLQNDFSYQCVVPARLTLTVTSGVIQPSVTVNNGGSYPNLANGTYPLTFIDNSTGHGAAGICTVANGVVTSATVTAGGTLYESPASYLASPAQFHITITAGAVSAVMVSSGGLQPFLVDGTYSLTVIAGPGGGSGAAVTATVVKGQVISVAITAPGSGYTSAMAYLPPGSPTVGP